MLTHVIHNSEQGCFIKDMPPPPMLLYQRHAPHVPISVNNCSFNRELTLGQRTTTTVKKIHNHSCTDKCDDQ